MDKNLVGFKFEAPNGKTAKFLFRRGTNDQRIIMDVFCKDKYKICNLDLKKGDTVIILGAHIGASTLLLATMRPDLKIYVYEALRKNFDLLLKNVKNNNVESEINLNNQAVWFYEEDDVKLYYGDNSEKGKKNKFIGSLFVNKDFYDKRAFKIASATNLSEMFEYNHISTCKFMKMDIEGSEYGLFKAAPKEVLQMIDRIHGEYHWIEPLPHVNLRKSLLKQTKGVYKDITPGGEKYPTGPFVFVKK